MVNTQKNVSKKTPLDTVMEEADSLSSGLQPDGVREEGKTNAENQREDVENVFDGLNDDKNPEDREEEDDNNDCVKGYYKDGYYYDHDPNLLQVTKELEATQLELVEQRKLTQKMKRMMEHIQNKFKDLAESDNDPSVEIMAEERAHKQT
uniref:Uncharacterized protein n=1 Tax=Cannabis sativa TaxID=3483 RepID=A0A803NIT0_CANSA